MTAKVVTVKLPNELVQAIDSHALAMGESRTSVIVNVLKQAFGLLHNELPAARTVPMVDRGYEEQLKEVADFKDRLGKLEGKVANHTEQIAELSLPVSLDSNATQRVTAISKYLIGLITKPPALVQPTEEVKPKTTDILPSCYLQIDNFLTQKERNQLLDHVLQQEPDFVPTGISTDELNYRRSMALYSFPKFSGLVINHIQAIIPDILSKLGLSLFPISRIEAQLTAHNEGNYYKAHNDNGSLEVATRELSYIYYFYQEPKPFSGGELLIYDSKIENNFYVAADSFKTVEPRNNSIVFFLSRYWHEVLPVSCPSKAFPDSRFTVNGWIRRQS